MFKPLTRYIHHTTSLVVAFKLTLFNDHSAVTKPASMVVFQLVSADTEVVIIHRKLLSDTHGDRCIPAHWSSSKPYGPF